MIIYSMTVRSTDIKKAMLQAALLICAMEIFLYKSVECVFFSLLKVKNLDAYDSNNKLRGVFEFCLSDSTISRIHEHAKTCFETLQAYLRATDCEQVKLCLLGVLDVLNFSFAIF